MKSNNSNQFNDVKQLLLINNIIMINKCVHVLLNSSKV